MSSLQMEKSDVTKITQTVRTHGPCTTHTRQALEVCRSVSCMLCILKVLSAEAVEHPFADQDGKCRERLYVVLC